jgi:hypothetical protein
VRLYLDNTTAVCYINKNGGTRSLALSSAAIRLTEFCESRRLSVEAVHLAGVLNVVADRESRSEWDSSDCMLCRNSFDRINSTFPSRVDLFSSAWNSQLPIFFSWGPQPGAVGVNAISPNWKKLSGYAFPPFTLIFKCLEKISREKANIVLVCPVWPTQPWFPVLLELVCDVPLLLKPTSTLLVSPLGISHPFLATGSLRLAVKIIRNFKLFKESK